MRKFLALSLCLAMTASLAGCSSSSTTDDTDTTAETTEAADDADDTEASDDSELPTVELTLWGAEEDQTVLQTMVDSFIEYYSDVANITVQLGVESESTAKDVVLNDISAAADVFAFASDQLVDLVNAGALQSIDELDSVLQTYAGKSVADVEEANVSGSVEAATYDDTLYAFPMSADNGFFLYYNSEILSEEDVASWDSLLAAAEEAGMMVGMTLASGWYNAGFFYAAGFTTGLNDDGTTICDFNGEADYTGVEVVQAMLNIAGNSAFLAITDGDITNQIASGSLCAVVSGTWDAEAAQTAFGDGYAATKLPTFTIAGDQVQQYSVAGFKLVGVNAYSENTGWATLLADWITNEENQTLRFEERQIGPSNINAAASDAVAENVAIAALSEQSAYGVVQLVGSNYWDPTETFGEIIAQGLLSADDTEAIQEALDEMVAGVTAAVE